MKIEITTDEAAKVAAAIGAAFGRVGAALHAAITALADAATSEDPEVKRVMGMCKEMFARDRSGGAAVHEQACSAVESDAGPEKAPTGPSSVPGFEEDYDPAL